MSAERGYLRETGNLVFHTALIGVLVAVGVGGGFGYTGQRVVVEGYAFANTLASYDSFNPGRFFRESDLVPYSIALDRFEPVYEQENLDALGQPVDFTAFVTTTMRGEEAREQRIKVNEPLAIGGTQVYLLGNGYAPELIVRDAEGDVVFSGPTPFLPQDANLFSLGRHQDPGRPRRAAGHPRTLLPRRRRRRRRAPTHPTSPTSSTRC